MTRRIILFSPAKSWDLHISGIVFFNDGLIQPFSSKQRVARSQCAIKATASGYLIMKGVCIVAVIYCGKTGPARYGSSSGVHHLLDFPATDYSNNMYPPYDQVSCISPVMLPSASFTHAVSLPPPTFLTACCTCAPASSSDCRLFSISLT